MKQASSIGRMRPPGRHFELPDDPHHDPYFRKGKHAAPSVCSGCHAVFQHGHWAWGTASAEAAQVLCPACMRIRDKQPGGYLSIGPGMSVTEHNELLSLLRHVEQRESADHAMERIMDVIGSGDTMLVTTTSPHLAQALAAAIERTFGGEAVYAFSTAEHLLRVRWQRDS